MRKVVALQSVAATLGLDTRNNNSIYAKHAIPVLDAGSAPPPCRRKRQTASAYRLFDRFSSGLCLAPTPSTWSRMMILDCETRQYGCHSCSCSSFGSRWTRSGSFRIVLEELGRYHGCLPAWVFRRLPREKGNGERSLFKVDWCRS